jgi:hypothetical protein
VSVYLFIYEGLASYCFYCCCCVSLEKFNNNNNRGIKMFQGSGNTLVLPGGFCFLTCAAAAGRLTSSFFLYANRAKRWNIWNIWNIPFNQGLTRVLLGTRLEHLEHSN